MNKTFKKIAVSIMAVTSLVVSMTSFSTSAVEPRYGGSSTFSVNGVSVTKSIDGYKTTAAGSTTCNSSLCSFVYVSVKGYYTATQYLSDSNYAVRGKVPVGFPADSRREFIKVTSYHSATINGISGDDDMIVTL